MPRFFRRARGAVDTVPIGPSEPISSLHREVHRLDRKVPLVIDETAPEGIPQPASRHENWIGSRRL